MRFKQENDQKNEDNKLYSSFEELLQLEEDKLVLIAVAIQYFYEKGNIGYKKFFKELYKCCCETRSCIEGFTYITFNKLPERTIHSINADDFKEDLKFFELLASMENEYVKLLSEAIDIAQSEKQWNIFNYLLHKLDEVKYLCNKALEAAKNKTNVLDLIQCEQHSMEK